MRFDLAMIFANDLERMTRFYSEVIGLTLVGSTRLPDWVEFEGEGARFSLHAIPADYRAEALVPVAREDEACKLVFLVDDLARELDRLEGLGVPILHRSWGGWDAVDPEGNVIGVRQAG